MENPWAHFLLVTTPMQGHINPARRLASRLMASMPGARVTFSTAVSGHRRMFPFLATPDGEHVDDAGVSYIPYSDGFDEGFKPDVHLQGSRALSSVVASLGRPVTCVVYTFLVGWVADVARAHGIPAALYWIQPAAVFAVYYQYFHGHGCDLPGLPPSALPSIVSITSPEHPHYLLLDMMRDLFSSLDEYMPKVLVNTFDALEHDAVAAFDLVSVGPVVPDDASSTDLFHRREDDGTKPYMSWLDKKPARSVVYVSFGSVLSMRKRQEEEMMRGLDATGRPYLWVAPARNTTADDGEGMMVVKWCDQVKVLSHPAVGCFVTHCGWNSVVESVACGVPMVAVPQWTDQPTVAWLVEACMGAGVRARLVDGDVVEGDELQRCVETVMGDGEVASRIRAQAERWKVRALEAVAAGGTSDRNLRAFVLDLSGSHAASPSN